MQDASYHWCLGCIPYVHTYVALYMKMMTCFRLAQGMWEHVNDRVLGVHTASMDSFSGRIWGRRDREQVPRGLSRFDDCIHYEPPDYYYIRLIRSELFGEGDRDEVFVDLGSGLGRILCVMARVPLRKVIGIELVDDLCRRSRINLTQMRRRKAPFEVICSDVLEASLDEGTTFFLFNAFGARTLEALCTNLMDSLARHPRQVRFVYYNDVHAEVLAANTDLQKVKEIKTFNGVSVSYWMSR